MIVTGFSADTWDVALQPAADKIKTNGLFLSLIRIGDPQVEEIPSNQVTSSLMRTVKIEGRCALFPFSL